MTKDLSASGEASEALPDVLQNAAHDLPADEMLARTARLLLGCGDEVAAAMPVSDTDLRAKAAS